MFEPEPVAMDDRRPTPSDSAPRARGLRRVLARFVSALAPRHDGLEARDAHTAASPRRAGPAPDESLAWLHLVSGPSGRRVAQAAGELCAHWIARGERVLLVDAGARLRLHQSFGAQPHLGLVECLAGEMPLLGLVQNPGIQGLYVLSYGPVTARPRWPALGQFLEDARQHFDRVLVAVDLGAPYEIGRVLAGRYYEAWWPDPDPARKAGAIALADRIAIRLHGMQLKESPYPVLEVIPARIESLRLPGAPTPLPVVIPATPPRLAAEPAPAPVPPEPIVLDCDLHVRERLRFLMWMRRVQSEHGTRARTHAQRGVPEPVSVTSG